MEGPGERMEALELEGPRAGSLSSGFRAQGRGCVREKEVGVPE